MYLLFSSDSIHNKGNNNNSRGQFVYHILSLSETTITIYEDYNGRNHMNLPCRVGADGKQHQCNPYDPEYTSKFENVFWGYLKCGCTENTRRAECSMCRVEDEKDIIHIFK